MNASSVLAHIDEVQEFLLRKKPLALMLSETCLTDEINDHEIECEGYKMFRNDSHSRYTGGCCIYIRDDVKSEIWNSSTLEKKVWILSVKISNADVNYVCTVVYVSPSASKKECIEYFEDWSEAQVFRADRQIIVGDFNVDFLKYGTYQTKLKNVMDSNGLKQFVKQATRITERSKSKIDLVMSNVSVEASVLRSEKVSDHSTIKIEIDGLRGWDVGCRTVRKIIDYSPEVLRGKLAEWQHLMRQSTDLNEKARTLSEKIIGAVEQFVKEVKVARRNANKWFDDGLKQMRTAKDHAYALAELVPSQSNWVKYRSARNKYLASIREKKRIYMERKLNKASGDAKQTWRILKTLLNGKRNGEIGEVEINGTMVSGIGEQNERILCKQCGGNKWVYRGESTGGRDTANESNAV